MNSNEIIPLLSTNNKPRVVPRNEIIIVYNRGTSFYYCVRVIVLIAIIIFIIVGSILIIKQTR